MLPEGKGATVTKRREINVHGKANRTCLQNILSVSKTLRNSPFSTS
jgi:hypothetical protein